uniref:ribonuclease 3-like protein 1 n=1 Tax=Erigeron canadensis TaxID=72917 RepID=UPI001CB9851B|nr:ribonuclease 3-like protein 1 [Erigeron canadensis]
MSHNLVPLTPSPTTPPAQDEQDTRLSNNDNNNNHSSPTPPAPGPGKLTARSALYEICAKSHLNRPEFVCCNETGPSNKRLFIYKVIIEMKEPKEGLTSTTVVECIGKQQSNKKAAAESAAEGLLWYLQGLGYPKKPGPSKTSR